MAIFWMASADLKEPGVWSSTLNLIIDTSLKRSGTASFCFWGYNAYVIKTFSARNELWGQVTYMHRQGAGQPANYVLSWLSESTELGSIRHSCQTLGDYYEAFVGATSVGLSPNRITSGFVTLEFYIKLDASGVIQVWLDGVLSINFAGNTKPGADTTFTSIRCGRPGGENPNYFNIDDIILADSAQRFYGAYVIVRSPTGAGNYTQFTPSTGSNWDCVNEIPPVVTDYVKGTALGQIDSYVLEDMPAEASEVIGAQIMSSGCTRVGACTGFEALTPFIRIAGTDYVGTAVPLYFGAQIIQQVRPINPATGIAWTIADINNLELGMETVAP